MLSIIMLHYGDEHQPMAVEAIRHVLANTTGDFELLLWDNGGDWGSDIEDARLRVHASGYRDSLARAYNRAVAQTTGDRICIIHNDCFVPPRWNERLMEIADDKTIAFPIVEMNEQSTKLRGVQPTVSWIPPSCCFVLTRSLLESIGGWDEQFEFCHFEDMDLFHRAQMSGVSLTQCPVTVFHIRGATRSVEAEARKANAAMMANQKLYVLKHGKPDKDGRWTAPMPVLAEMPKEALCHSTTMATARI